jgi:hypothetical protein
MTAIGGAIRVYDIFWNWRWRNEPTWCRHCGHEMRLRDIFRSGCCSEKCADIWDAETD